MLRSIARPLAHSIRQTGRSSLQKLMSTSTTTTTPGPMETSIRSKITELLQPIDLKITNDSWQHRHHAAMRAVGGGDGETHFSVQVISEAFAGKRTMQRHRMIYGALADEFQQGLHALQLDTKTPEEATRAAPTSA